LFIPRFISSGGRGLLGKGRDLALRWPCHFAPCPDKEWRGWMDKMSRKVRLQPEQKELLVRYLDLYRGGGKTNLLSP
jgi:hypothetical protein